MNENKNKRTAKITLITIIAVLTIIMANTALALTINAPNTITGEPGEEITIPINITGGNGTINLTRTPEIGTITSTNNTHKEFKWITTYDTEETHKKITFKAKDENNQTTEKEIIIAKPPKISLESSGGTIQKETYEIELKTSIDATCKYDLEEKEYAEKQYTLKKDGKTHTGTTPTLEQGHHTIHITCKSEHNAKSNAEIPLEVSLKPTAEIRLSPRPPLRAGIVKVEVIASEDLITTPELRYYFDDDTTPRSITLTGSGRRWEGYIVISESDKKRIGTFTFKGTDKTNIEGTEITNGKVFIVDNSKPVQVTSITSEVQGDRIKIEWRYLEEERDNIKEYRVYRKKGSGGVDYIDYYETTTNNYFYDTNVEYEEAYYYKISAVNHAGQEGELSREIAITFRPETTSAERETRTEELAPALRTLLNSKISQVERIIMDIESAERQLQRATGRELTETIQNLDILSRIASSKNKINNIKGELEKLKDKSLSEEEFGLSVDTFMEEAENEMKRTPIGVEIKDSASYEEFSDDEKAREAIEEYFSFEGLDVEESDTRSLINTIVTMQDLFLVEVTLIKAEIQYPDHSETASIVKKRISSQETIENAEVLEKIPNRVAQTATDINFLERPEIIRQNPLVKWTAERLGTKTITYYVKEDIDMSDLRDTKTIVVSGEDIEQKQNLITGRAVQAEEDTDRHPLFIPLIIGIMTVLLLTTYYVKYASNDGLGSTPRIITRIKEKVKDKNMNILPKKKDDSHRKILIEHHEPERKEPVKTEKKKCSFEEQEIHVKDISERKTSDIDEVKEVLVTIKDLCEELRTQTKKEKKGEASKKKVKIPRITKAPEDKAFVLRNGQKLKTVKELKESLKTMDEETFRHHVNHERNDFSEWIKHVFKDKELARKIKTSKTKNGIMKKIKP